MPTSASGTNGTRQVLHSFKRGILPLQKSTFPYICIANKGKCFCLAHYEVTIAKDTVNSQSRKDKAIPHNSKCRYCERGAAAARPKAQIILDAAKVSAASGGNSEPKQGQRSQSARGFCLRSTMRVPQSDIIEHFGNADAVPQPPERCLSRQAGIVRCCLRFILLPLLSRCCCCSRVCAVRPVGLFGGCGR